MVSIDLSNHRIYEFTFTTVSSPALDHDAKISSNYEDKSFNLWRDSGDIGTRGKVDLSKAGAVSTKISMCFDLPKVMPSRGTRSE
jgi:hypothetical protein